jgi:hypothetical protein
MYCFIGFRRWRCRARRTRLSSVRRYRAESLERAGFGDARMQFDRNDLAGAAAFGRQRGLDLVELLQFFGRPVVEQRADLILPTHR